MKRKAPNKIIDVIEPPIHKVIKQLNYRRLQRLAKKNGISGTIGKLRMAKELMKLNYVI